jgi:pyruvate kinase
LFSEEIKTNDGFYKVQTANIRILNKKLNRNVGILGDLQGPKLRIGKVKDNAIDLVNGQEIVITTKECEGTAEKIF